ncbi:MAG: lysophospholipid acyltransferase family protein [Acidobacteriota bacterium]|jgi:lauroyl/myristoyl acyltransferase
MSSNEIYDSWRVSGANNRWVYYMLDAGCRLVSRRTSHRVADSIMEWYSGRDPGLPAVVAGNLRKAFPALPPHQIEWLAMSTLRSYARGVADYLRARRDPPLMLPPGDGNHEALADPGGKVILCAHMGNWELGGVVLGKRIGPHWVLAFPERDEGLDRFRRRRRDRAGLVTVHPGEGLDTILHLRRLLEQGRSLIVLVDREVGRDRIEVTFRNRSTYFLKSPALLAEMADVPVIPVAVMAEGRGSYRPVVGRPCRLRGLGSQHPGETMQRAADFFSGILERYPDQWYNFFPFWGEDS